jgi:DNA-binding NarL/FixJ family response regulator
VIRIGVADEHTLARTGLVSLLRSNAGMRVVGEVADGAAAYELACDQQPDVMVVDLGLTDIDGFEVTKRISARHPSVAVVVMAPRGAEGDAGRAITAGARAYVLRTTPAEDVLRTVRMAADGHVVLPGQTTLAFAAPMQPSRSRETPILSTRELDVLRLLALGLTNRHIAERLLISAETVKTHVERIMRRLGAADRTEAVAVGFRTGLLE